MEIRNFQVNGWDVRHLSEPVVTLPLSIIEEGRAIIERWSSLFARENTWAQQELGIPSLIVRLDETICDGELRIYEVEERPSGIGVSSIVNPQFASKLKELQATWPPFQVVISSARGGEGTDDYLWAPVTKEEPDPSFLLLVRAEPEETEFHHYEPRSLSSLREKGNKSYGVEMGLWTAVSSPDALPWETGFVLKPQRGSKTRGIEIWHPVKQSGTSTRTKITRALLENGTMYCQPFHHPMMSGLEGCPWMILRVFYGYCIASKSWRCLGGCWNARPNLKIHGASDSLLGPVII